MEIGVGRKAKEVTKATPSVQAARRLRAKAVRQMGYPSRTLAGDQWDDFIHNIILEYSASKKRQSEIQELKLSNKLSEDVKYYCQSLYDKPESVLKREVYRFVRKNFGNQKPGSRHIKNLRDILYASIDYSSKMRVPFSENYYHWVLAALCVANINLRHDQITIFGRQLMYAHRHHIAPDLLVGFLHQTGNPLEISKKYLDKDYREPWFNERYAR